MAFKTLARCVCFFCFALSLSAEYEAPLWNYTPMNTVDVFEGIVFGFFLPPTSIADVTVTAQAEGKEVYASRRISTDSRAVNTNAGMFPMQVGNLNEFRVTHIDIRIGNYRSSEENPSVSKDYALSNDRS